MLCKVGIVSVPLLLISLRSLFLRSVRMIRLCPRRFSLQQIIAGTCRLLERADLNAVEYCGTFVAICMLLRLDAQREVTIKRPSYKLLQSLCIGPRNHRIRSRSSHGCNQKGERPGNVD
jgi:hypothetical protein